MSVIIYGRATSSNVQTVMWGAAELGVPVERLDYGFNFGGTDSPEFKAMSPHGLVPVLRDGETVMWESCATLRYLAARYGDGGAFWPADPAQRARVDMWAEWGKTTLISNVIGQVFWPLVRMSAAERDPVAVDAGIAKVGRLLDILGDQISGDFILGDTLTVADVVIGNILFRWFTMEISRPENAVVEAYYSRLTQRPAYARHVMVDYSILRHPQA